MPKISFYIPDKKVPFIMELLQKFDFVTLDPIADKTTLITEEPKALVEIERKKAKENPAYLMDWETAKKTLMV